MKKGIKEIKEILKDTNKTWTQVIQVIEQAIEFTTNKTLDTFILV